MKRSQILFVLILVLGLGLFVRAQNQATATDDMSDMAGMQEQHDHQVAGAEHAMHSMESHHLGAGAHMKMTSLREPSPQDQKRAAEIVDAARKSVEKYRDYKTALTDGYQIFLPNVPHQKIYHFTNYRYAIEAGFHFSPEHPTSLLYEKRGENYRLIGVMYTAPKTAGEDELNQRVPLSVAQWHAHVNLCVPPLERRREMWGQGAKFGLAGSITTQQECEAAGGKFMPQVFGWMVHMYPYEQKPEDIWSVERQLQGHNHGD